jgi:5-amino-6-(5-phosphoribosylamino)uracil reductase
MSRFSPPLPIASKGQPHSGSPPLPLRPFVVANFALTWDGRISTRNHTPSDFSSAADKSRLLEIRSEGDAVLASATTVSADTMTMGLPLPALREARVARGQEPYPLRVLWTRSGHLSTGLRLFSAASAPIVVMSEEGMPLQTRHALASLASVRLAPPGGLSPEWALQMLARHHGVRKVVLEGGGTLLRLFLASRCVDELCLTWCPRVFGGSTGITLTGLPGDFLPSSVQARLLRMEQTGSECFTRWGLKYQRIFSGKR